MKFDLKYRVHDMRGSRRGQGKRSGGMIVGAMAARVDEIRELDVEATFGLSGDDAAEVRLFNRHMLDTYHKAREAGKSHHDAALAAYEVMD